MSPELSLQVRKTASYVERLHTEFDQEIDPPHTIAVAAAVIRNPWIGRGFVQDLKPEIRALGPELGTLLSRELVDVMGGADGVEAYGKAAIVGLDGELEHASALIHTLHFGDVFREMAGGTSYLSFTNRRAVAGAVIVVPLIHKLESWRRSHFLTADMAIADAPRAGEIVVAIAAASGGRPFARIGDRHQDEAELAGTTPTATP